MPLMYHIYEVLIGNILSFIASGKIPYFLRFSLSGKFFLILVSSWFLSELCMISRSWYRTIRCSEPVEPEPPARIVDPGAYQFSRKLPRRIV